MNRPLPETPEPGMCAACLFVRVNPTRRGTTYLRCGRAAWDARLVKYPRLPVVTCVGFVVRTPP
jgi:hypothetical protein